MNATLPAIATEYLRTVERGLAPLPRGRRDEVVADLREHLAASLEGAATEADVRDVLDRLGAPREVARAALAEAGVVAQPKPVMEWWAVFLVSAGSVLLPVLGWLAGISMVWSSRIWQRRLKVAATLMFPLGFGGVFVLWRLYDGLGEDCVYSPHMGVCTARWVSNPALVAFFVYGVLSPFVSTLLLIRALSRHREATAL
ncbi:MAG TPA: hypothetical protein VGX28_10315 [Frankiaceae bacterium]|jgi:hypothetical protein|nr:hypothetical protein [Frankiaceae bacterium]